MDPKMENLIFGIKRSRLEKNEKQPKLPAFKTDKGRKHSHTNSQRLFLQQFTGNGFQFISMGKRQKHFQMVEYENFRGQLYAVLIYGDFRARKDFQWRWF